MQIAFFNVNTAGDNLNVIPAAGRATDFIRIYGGILFSGGAVTVRFKDSLLNTYGAAFALTNGQILCKDLQNVGGLIDIPAGRSFGFNLSAAVQVNGLIAYEYLVG